MRKQDFNLEIFANRFTELLNTTDETVYSIASKVGLTPSTISRYSNAKLSPKLPTLYAISEIFDVNPIWLMGCEAEKEISNPSIKNSPEEPKLTEGEKKCLELYNRISEDSKELFINLLEAFDKVNADSQPMVAEMILVALKNQR